MRFVSTTKSLKPRVLSAVADVCFDGQDLLLLVLVHAPCGKVALSTTCKTFQNRFRFDVRDLRLAFLNIRHERSNDFELMHEYTGPEWMWQVDGVAGTMSTMPVHPMNRNRMWGQQADCGVPYLGHDGVNVVLFNPRSKKTLHRMQCLCHNHWSASRADREEARFHTFDQTNIETVFDIRLADEDQLRCTWKGLERHLCHRHRPVNKDSFSNGVGVLATRIPVPMRTLAFTCLEPVNCDADLGNSTQRRVPGYHVPQDVLVYRGSQRFEVEVRGRGCGVEMVAHGFLNLYVDDPPYISTEKSVALHRRAEKVEEFMEEYWDVHHLPFGRLVRKLNREHKLGLPEYSDDDEDDDDSPRAPSNLWSRFAKSRIPELVCRATIEWSSIEYTCCKPRMLSNPRMNRPVLDVLVDAHATVDEATGRVRLHLVPLVDTDDDSDSDDDADLVPLMRRRLRKAVK